ncbi:HAD family hydrolase [Protofrankia coriariae]|uniref:HAD family hydrolase n=1 Tax=Protofrankia coriariae TaxID=1562887 RepID=UPI00069BB14B|nr:HAD family phosphatase [Protofrankia coriariae]
MIGAVVFDVGGVLCPSPVGEFEKVDAEYGLPAGTVMSFVRGGELFARCETGRMPIAEFYRRCSSAIAEKHHVDVPAQRLDAMLWACMGDSVRPEMVALVVEVKAAGYQTALLTNIFAERRDWLHTLLPAGTIDAYGDSSELGLRKPDPTIYRRLLAMLGRGPREVAFVDDFPENLVPARDLGMVGVLYESSRQVRRALVEAGVRITLDPLDGRTGEPEAREPGVREVGAREAGAREAGGSPRGRAVAPPERVGASFERPGAPSERAAVPSEEVA